MNEESKSTDPLQMEIDENSRLRELILGLAGRPEITKETRQWLAAKLRERGKTHIVHDQKTDDNIALKKIIRSANRLIDKVREAINLPESQHPTPLWYQGADHYCNELSCQLQEIVLERDISDLEEGV